MLEFKRTDTSAELILTLTEMVSIDNANYLFVFTNVLTKDIISFVKLQGDDESAFPERYNQFTIDPASLFLQSQPGEWHYQIYEQESTTNLDPVLAGGKLEDGKLIIEEDPAFQFTKYDSPTTFKTYNG